MPMPRLAALLLLLAPAGVAAEPAVTAFRLANGLDAVVIEDHRAPVVTHMVWYRVGAADDPRGKSGIAHFLEHLMFKGTDEIPEGAFSKIVAANGGQDNAFTTPDHTAYFQRIAADRLGLVMRMEADRMRDLVLSDAVVASERDVVLEERASRVDSSPAALFGEERDAAQYLNHPYGIPVIGWRHEIAALTREDALDAYRRFYAPNNAILIVAGDVTPEEVRRLAEEHYGPLAPTPGLAPRLRPQEPPQRAARRLAHADPKVRQPYLIRTWLAPERNPGDQRQAAALAILAELLGGSEVTSFLGRALQIDAKLALGTGAFYDGTALDPTTFGVYVAPAPGVSLAEAEAALDAALARFLATPIDAARLDRVRGEIRAAQIYAQDSQVGLANRYGRALSIGLTLADVAEWPRLLETVTAEEVLAAGRAVLDPGRSVTGWLAGSAEALVQ